MAAPRVSTVLILPLLLALCAPVSAGLLGIDSNYVLHDINTVNGVTSNPRSVGNKVNMIAISPGGILYGVSQGFINDGPPGQQLFTINIATGAPTLVDTLSQPIIVEGDIACDPTTGILYGVDSTGELYTINTTSALVVQVGTIGTNTDLSAATFDASGTLWVVDSFGPTLLKVNKANGAVLMTVPLDPINQEVGGLAFSPAGTLFHAAGTTGKLYTLNTTTGQALTIGPLAPSGGIWGLAWTPEPVSLEPSSWSRIKALVP
ncbi:MAG TPA: hypothetical protein VF720_16545 [Candidatus Eisenbacteria bacterium]